MTLDALTALWFGIGIAGGYALRGIVRPDPPPIGSIWAGPSGLLREVVSVDRGTVAHRALREPHDSRVMTIQMVTNLHTFRACYSRLPAEAERRLREQAAA